MQPVEIAVLENAVVSTANPFPGSVVDDDYFAGGWMNKAQGYYRSRVPLSGGCQRKARVGNRSQWG